MRYLSSGESHGPELTAIIDGFPANVKIDLETVNFHLSRRQKGHGRGGRMKIEKDQAQIVAGVRFSHTTGAPICIKVNNNDWVNWEKKMAHFGDDFNDVEVITKPRPGHADLTGAMKYQQRDIRNILERASARETTIRVAIGAFVRQLLEGFGVQIYSHVLQIGRTKVGQPVRPFEVTSSEDWKNRIEESPVRCYDQTIADQMMQEIDSVKQQGDSVGGIVEIVVTGLPIGLGSYVHWEHKLDSKLASAILSVQAIKGVEFGLGFDTAEHYGSEVHDPIYYQNQQGFYRDTNRAGGIEGGMTNGEPVIIRAVMKPIPTLYKPLQSVDINSKAVFEASIERSDSCAVPAAAVVLENVVAWELANAFIEKFSGNSIEEIKLQFDAYQKLIDQY
ncbi:chorismate synthase [Desulfuribacillus stibiiarsenatis]|uniref:Chorismate synthase n=1 Tax=Desulfuribacillus stibiiarsenatis TaxID=1390249 RepID=A0A1E5L7N0_9FIRM|nr:chorismate synthase [Desulfuribacillus stibiiarsenatis]